MTQTGVLKRGRANLQTGPRSFMSAGGKLELTTEALRFVPNWTNLGLATEITIPLTEIEGVLPERPLIFGVMPSFWHNGMRVLGRQGRFDYVISLWGRAAWIEAIEAARKRRG